MIQVFILHNDIYTPNLMVAAMCSDTNVLDKVLRDSLLICSGRQPLKQCYRWSFIVVNDKLARFSSFPPLRPHSCPAQSDRVFWMRLQGSDPFPCEASGVAHFWRAAMMGLEPIRCCIWVQRKKKTLHISQDDNSSSSSSSRLQLLNCSEQWLPGQCTARTLVRLFVKC